jgi:hypothetical protein
VDVEQIVAGAALGDSFFIRAGGHIAGGIGISATGLNASTTVGDLTIATVGGEVSGSVAVGISLKDPGTTAADGRIDLNEFSAASPANVIDLDISASVTVTNLEISAGDFLNVQGSFTIGYSLLEHVTVTDGASSQVLNEVSALTIGTENGSIFIGANHGTAAETGFNTTIEQLAVVIIEHGATSRTWHAVSTPQSSSARW